MPLKGTDYRGFIDSWLAPLTPTRSLSILCVFLCLLVWVYQDACMCVCVCVMGLVQAAGNNEHLQMINLLNSFRFVLQS